MTPLFPRWSNTALLFGAGLLGALVVGTPVLLMVWVRTPYVTHAEQQIDQPIEFDHRHHARDDGLDCRYCHYEAFRSPYAGVPPTQVCMNCHGQVWQESERLKPVRESWFNDEPLRWTRVHQLPDFVFFNHSAHVMRGVGCTECHGRVDQMASVHQVHDLTMRWCLDCHRHPDAHLRPLDRVTDMDWNPSLAERLEIGRKVRRDLGVNPPVNCTTCHR